MGTINLDRATKNDLNQIIKEVGEPVWFYRATRSTTNIGGDPVITYASKRRETVVFQFNDEKYDFTREGLIRTPELAMYSRSSLAPVRRDIVVPTRNNRSYTIQKTTIRNKVAMSELTELTR